MPSMSFAGGSDPKRTFLPRRVLFHPGQRFGFRRVRPIGLFLALLMTAVAGPAQATPDGPAPPVGYLDRSGVGELVFWQGVNGLLAGSVLGYAITAGQLDSHCRTTYGADHSHSQECKDAVGRGAGITVVGLAAGVSVPLLVSRGRALKTGDALLVNRSTLIG